MVHLKLKYNWATQRSKIFVINGIILNYVIYKVQKVV